MTRRAALAIAWRARRRHPRVRWKYRRIIAFACRKHRVRWALGFALVQQESGFRHIYGHDAGGMLPGQRVTRRNYRWFRRRIRETGGRGANGVGLTQLTWWTYIRDHADLWKPKANVHFGLGLIAAYIDKYGERQGLAIYNGGPSNPQYGYADQVRGTAEHWREILDG